jgi:hypothetical protein
VPQVTVRSYVCIQRTHGQSISPPPRLATLHARAGARTKTIAVGQPPMWCSGSDDLMGGGSERSVGPVLGSPYALRADCSVPRAT